MTDLTKTKPSPDCLFLRNFTIALFWKGFRSLTAMLQLPWFFTRYTKTSYVSFVRGRIYTFFLTFVLFSFAQWTISINIINKKVITKCFFILAANYDNNSLSSTNYFKSQNREINLQLPPEIQCIYSSFEKKKKNFLRAWLFKIRILVVYFYIHDQKASSKYQNNSFLFLWHV